MQGDLELEAFGLEVVLTPDSSDYDANDERWLGQVADLHERLRETGTLRIDHTPVAGTKGSVETVILALGSSGALYAALEAFKAWLARDRKRSLKLRLRDGAHEQEISVEGDKIQGDQLDIAFREGVKALKQRKGR